MFVDAIEQWVRWAAVRTTVQVAAGAITISREKQMSALTSFAAKHPVLFEFGSIIRRYWK